MDLQSNSGITGNGAKDQLLVFRENPSQHQVHQHQTDVCSSVSSDEMAVIFCPPFKNILVVTTVSVTANSGSQASPQEGGNTRHAIGPPRNCPIQLIGLVFSPNLHAVLRFVELYHKGKVRIQDLYNARRRPLLDTLDLVAIPVDISTGNHNLRDQLIRLRQSREANERDRYDTTDDLDKIKAHVFKLTNMLDESRAASLLLFAEVFTLKKKQTKRPKISKVHNTGANTDTVSASGSFSKTYRHLRGVQSEFRSLHSQLLRGSQISKPQKIKRKPRSRSSSSSSSSSSETE